MKKITISLIVAMGLLSFNAFANERVVPASALPQKATAFLNQYFSGIAVAYVEEDKDDFEVNLNNGIEVTFSKNGEWDQVDGKYQAIPTGFIAQPILDTIKNKYTGAYILQIEKDWWAGFEVELSNNMELKIDENGKVSKVEYD